MAPLARCGLSLSLILVLLAPTVASAQAYTTTTAPLGMATIAGDPNTSTHFDGSVALFADDAVVVTLPFDFVYFGQSFATGSPVTISTTGYLALGDYTAGRLGSNGNSSLPSSAFGLPDAMICPFWDRVTGRSSAKVQSLVRGPTGARELIVEWHDTGDSTSQVFGQAILREGSQIIEFRYAPNIDPGSATVGLEDPTSTIGIQPYGVNVGTIPFNLVFSPPPSPDLLVTAEATRSRASEGQTLLFERIIRNVGATATSVLVHYVISEDHIIDSSDPVFATETIPTLSGSTAASVSLTLPSTISTELYRIGVIVDPNDTISESDESNNSAVTGVMRRLRGRYRRETFPIGAYASILGTGETRLYDGMVNPAQEASTTVPLPFPFEFFSSSETSIRISTSGCVTFDFAAEDNVLFDFSGVGRPAGVIGVLWTPLEVETATNGVIAMKVEGAPGSRVFIVEWSGLEEADDDSPPVGNISAQLRLYEGSNHIEMRYPDPASQDFSSFLRYQTLVERPDGLERVAGTTFGSEQMAPTRNFRFIPTTPIEPDFRVESFELLQTDGSPGVEFLCTLELINNGGASSGALDASFVLSDDAVIDASDVMGATVPLAAMAAGEVRRETLALTVPASIASGDRFLGVTLNPTGAVPEFERADNSAVTGESLTIGAPLLVPVRLPVTGYQSIVGQAGATTIFSEATSPGFDDENASVQLPFVWTFARQAVSMLTVSTNGWASPDLSVAPVSSPRTLPSSSAPDGGLFVCWTDLESNGFDSAVVTATQGSAPSRVFVVEWSRLQRFNSSGVISGQLRIHEGSDRVELRYPEPATQDWSTVQATVGVESPDELRGWSPVSLGNRVSEPPTVGLALEPFIYTGIELEVTGAVSLAPTIPPGETAGMTVQVKNFGDTDSGPFDIVLVLSQNTSIEATDPTLATVASAGIPARGSATFTLVGVVSPGQTTGAAFVGALVDPAGLLTETLTANNASSARPVSIGTARDLRDLTVTSATLQNTTFRINGGPSGTPPGVETLTVTVANTGTIDYFNADLRLLFSPDMDFDEEDALRMATSAKVSVLAGGTTSVTMTAEFLVFRVQPGPGFFAVEVEPSVFFRESDYENNLSTPQPITLLPVDAPDLTPAAVTVTPTIFAPGDNVVVEGVIRNIGGLPYSGSARIDVDLFQPPASNTQLDSVSFASFPVAAGADVAFGPLQVVIPTSLQDGPGVVALDIENTGGEGGTSNNTNRFSIEVHPPAPVLVASASSQAQNLLPFGPRTTVLQRHVGLANILGGRTSAILNQGVSAVGPFEVGVYITGIGTIQPGVLGERIAGFTVPSLAPGVIEPARSYQGIAPDLAAGTYKVAIFIDDGFDVMEDDEGDNTDLTDAEEVQILDGELGTDLFVLDFEVSTTMTRPGAGIQLTRRVGNLRANPALAFSTAVRLSADAQINGADPQIDIFASPVGLLGLEAPSTGTVIIPVGTAAGTYTLGLVVDDAQQVPEADETNNIATVQLTISGTPRCDVTGDGMVSISDVQGVINAALGVGTPFGTEDLNGDASVNVQDVQIVIGAALGGPCP